MAPSKLLLTHLPKRKQKITTLSQSIYPTSSKPGFFLKQ